MEKGGISVLGSGSWATALVKILSESGDTINWWVNSQEKYDYISDYGRNPKYLSSAELKIENIKLTQDIKEAIAISEYLVVVIPSAFLHDCIKDLPLDIFDGKIIFSSIKGVIPEFDQVPAEYFKKRFNLKYKSIGIIAGPCHAEEIAMQRLSYLTVACKDTDRAQYIAEKLECRYVKTSFTDDVLGMEISAVLKNVFAIASGICHGLGYGDNFQAVLVSNALQEISRFVDKKKPIHRDVKSSAYLGDLLVTAYSQFSRNRTFGTMIGKGYSVRSAKVEMNMVAEGYYAVKSIVAMNEKLEVDMPITEAVYRILYQNITPVVEMKILTNKLT
ncbi:MAG: glycerol-3-phosphate dehydrogenase (NAD(P)+) [Patiriisocius sp.]|jgi:glycerol-3-phosphate dehydrogenase (NAD(P)+)